MFFYANKTMNLVLMNLNQMSMKKKKTQMKKINKLSKVWLKNQNMPKYKAHFLMN